MGRPCVLLLILGLVGYVCSFSVNVGSTPVGPTSPTLGVNLGHFRQDSNGAQWFKFVGSYAIRFFLTPTTIEPVDDIAPFGDGVTSLDTFLARKYQLRAAERSNTNFADDQFIAWSKFIANYNGCCSGSNIWDLPYTFNYMKSQNISILGQITAGENPPLFPALNPKSDWPARWELWQHYYAQAFYLSKTYGIVRYSMFNEPDLGPAINMTNFIDRFILCSDAIQSAISDVNAQLTNQAVTPDQLLTSPLQPMIHAPTLAGAIESYSDGWGPLTMAALRTRLDGTIDNSWTNAHVYDYHYYSTSLNNFGARLVSLLNATVTDMGDDMSNWLMTRKWWKGVGLSEYNIRTASSYDTMTATMDDAPESTRLAAVSIVLQQTGAAHMFCFKFAQTKSSYGRVYPVVKNGLSFADNSAGVYGGLSRSGHVIRLVNIAARPGKLRMPCSFSNNYAGRLYCLATYQPSTKTVNLLVSNMDSAPLQLDLDFSTFSSVLNLASAWYSLTEVSDSNVGTLVAVNRLSATATVSLSLPVSTVWLITLIPATTNSPQSFLPADKATVFDGINRAIPQVAFSKPDTINRVRHAFVDVSDRAITLFKFNLPTAAAAAVLMATLRMSVATVTAGSAPVLHVYGVTDSNWNGATVTFSQLAWLTQGSTAGPYIRNNVVHGRTGVTRVLGQVTANDISMRIVSLDVTSFVADMANLAAPGSTSFNVTIAVVHESRVDVQLPSLTPGDVPSDGAWVGATALDFLSANSLVAMELDAETTETVEMELDADIEAEADTEA